MTTRLLIVDDDPDHCANLSDFCEEVGWETRTACSTDDAERLLEAEAFSLMVLDVTMPGLNGVSYCRRLRARGEMIPILMLTANTLTEERVEGLNAGADDYLGKPFSLAEFEARAAAVLRRAPAEKLIVGDLVYDVRQRRAVRAGKPLKVRGLALRILEELMKASPNVVTRETLTAALWPEGDVPQADSLRANMHLLRSVVDRPFHGALIRTHPGVGWSIGEAEKPDRQAPSAPGLTGSKASSS